MTQVENDSVKPPPFTDLGPITDTEDATDRLALLFSAEDGDENEFNQIADKIERKPAPRTQPDPQLAQADAAPESADTTEQADPDENPTVEPPKSWSAEQKAVWNSLPPETQNYVLQRETERDTALRRGQNELAEQRKAFEAERQAQLQQAAEFSNQLPMLQRALLERVQNSETARMTQQDWLALASSDPARYVELQAKAQADAQLLQATMQAQQRLEAQRQAEQAASQQEMLKAEWNKLIETDPDFADPVKGPALQQEITAFMTKELGVPVEALNAMNQHWMVRGAKLAMIGAKALADAKNAPQKVKNLPPVSRPTASRANPSDRSMQQFGADKTNISRVRSTEDAAAILERYL